MRFLALRINLIRTFASKANQGTTPSKTEPLKNVIGKCITFKVGNKILEHIIIVFIKGLSSKCVENNEERQVLGTGKDYKNPEYFGYNRMSYTQAEVEMEKFRVPQPVAPRK